MDSRIEYINSIRNSSAEFQKQIEAEYVRRLTALVAKLKSARQEQGLSQQDIADATGMKAPNITRLETMKSRPSLEVLMRYAEALGYEVDIELKRKTG